MFHLKVNNIQFTDHRVQTQVVQTQVKRAIFNYTIRIEQVLDQTMSSLVILESQIGKESNNFMLGLPAYSKHFKRAEPSSIQKEKEVEKSMWSVY